MHSGVPNYVQDKAQDGGSILKKKRPKTLWQKLCFFNNFGILPTHVL
jgi:hypothetical protein